MNSHPTRPTISIDSQDSRYSRLEMIPWWDQAKLKAAKIVVVGAGALGNEIIKNLALLGVGNILIIDFDQIEASNLSRSILYKESDEGCYKAHSAAETARRVNPECQIYSLNADVTWEVGLGIFRWADVVIGGLDNREARLAVNRACWKANRPWVDGATESFQGVARVFTPPNGVCYECTLSEQDFKFMEARNSCGFLAGEAYRTGSVPTTPTTSSVIAGIEVQEAIKLLHPDSGLSGLAGRGFFFDGGSYDCFTIEYTYRDDCLSHETYCNIIESSFSSEKNTLADVMDLAKSHLGGPITVDLPCEMVEELHCGTCGSTRKFYRLLNAVEPQEALCESCRSVMVPNVVGQCTQESPFASTPLALLGFGIMDIIPARSGDKEVEIEISHDRKTVFGVD